MTLNFVQDASRTIEAGFQFFSSCLEENKETKLALVALGGVAAMFILIKHQGSQKPIVPFLPSPNPDAKVLELKVQVPSSVLSQRKRSLSPVSPRTPSQLAEIKLGVLLVCVPMKERNEIEQFSNTLKELKLASPDIYSLLELLGLITGESRKAFFKHAPLFLVPGVSAVGLDECITIISVLELDGIDALMDRVGGLVTEDMNGDERIGILKAEY